MGVLFHPVNHDVPATPETTVKPSVWGFVNSRLVFARKERPTLEAAGMPFPDIEGARCFGTVPMQCPQKTKTRESHCE